LGAEMPESFENAKAEVEKLVKKLKYVKENGLLRNYN
jgi:hypothetical protein